MRTRIISSNTSVYTTMYDFDFVLLLMQQKREKKIIGRKRIKRRISTNAGQLLSVAAIVSKQYKLFKYIKQALVRLLNALRFFLDSLISGLSLSLLSKLLIYSIVFQIIFTILLCFFVSIIFLHSTLSWFRFIL